MIDLAPIIKKLVYKNSEVVIPGIGRFYKKRIVDGYGNVQGDRTFAFKKYDEKGAGSLAQHLIFMEGLKLAEAKTTVDNYVAELKNSVALNGEFYILGIGMLKSNENGDYFLVPQDELDRDGLGMPMSKTKRVWWVVPIILLLGGALFWLAYQSLRSQENTTSKVNIAEQNDDVPTKEESPKVDKQDIGPDIGAADRVKKEESLKQSSPDGESSEESDSETIPMQKTYHIIVGSFTDCGNSEKQVLSLKQRGYTQAKSLKKENDLGCRTSLKSYPDSLKAEVALKGVTLAFENAWILSEVEVK